MIRRLATRLARSIDRLSARLSPEVHRNPETPPIPPDLTREVDVTRIRVDDALARADHALEVARDMSLPTRMLAFMYWLELRPPEPGPMISVILATRDRPELLARAIASVRSQRYERWELIVVDDGDTDAVARTLSGNKEDRVVMVQGPRRGVAAARNVGLHHATGEIVCYADDDNVMHPAWLQAVAHVFSQRKDVDVAYGISITEHRLSNDLTEHGWWPSFWQLPWSRDKLLEENVTDTGSMAHRRNLDGASFDESLSGGEDWDLLLHLTADRDAMAIPAISHAYASSGNDHMSARPGHKVGLEEVRRKHSET